MKGRVKYLQVIALIAPVSVLSFPANAASQEASTMAAFRKGVMEYQGFVVPHCAPDDVEAYTATRAVRDRTFVESLRGTRLASLFRRAVRDQAKQDRATVYECMGPPPPPPPPGMTPTQIAELTKQQEQERFRQREQGRRDFFRGGDAAFQELVVLRDQILSRQGKHP